jgi:3-oxoacyl-[acyl-carrier-protein] synthase III
MGTRIESVRTVGGRGLLSRGALKLSEAASRACLERARRGADEIDLLLSTGIYKDRNVAEPALAAVIQDDIGANRGHPPRRGRHGTFSFDVLNGGCGCLTAAYLADAFLADGPGRLALVVAGDADPAPGETRDFPFRPLGGAMLLAHTDGAEGFDGFEFRTFAADARLFEARLAWDAEHRSPLGRRGRNVLTIREDARFVERAVEHGAKVAASFLDRARLRPEDVDLLVASPYPSGFADRVGRAVGVSAERIARPPWRRALGHTAGPLAALEVAVEEGAFDRAKNVLFVTAGAGVSIAVALYRR